MKIHRKIEFKLKIFENNEIHINEIFILDYNFIIRTISNRINEEFNEIKSIKK